MYYYLERFYHSVGGEPYPHIDQFNLDLGQPPPPLFCFSFVYDFVMYYMYVVFFLCASSIFIISFYYNKLFVWNFWYSTNCKMHVYFSNYFEDIICKILSHTKFVSSIKTCCRIFLWPLKENGEGKERKIHTEIKESSLM